MSVSPFVHKACLALLTWYLVQTILGLKQTNGITETRVQGPAPATHPVLQHPAPPPQNTAAGKVPTLSSTQRTRLHPPKSAKPSPSTHFNHTFCNYFVHFDSFWKT
ncbi:unnamed protein product [Arctogadus glacialis]